jgi:hypothetical protein
MQILIFLILKVFLSFYCVIKIEKDVSVTFQFSDDK